MFYIALMQCLGENVLEELQAEVRCVIDRLSCTTSAVRNDGAL